MSDTVAIALAQTNPTVGDIDGNLERIRDARAEAAAAGADLVILGELVLAGYPPEDLVLKPAFMECIEQRLDALRADTARGGPAVLLGTPWRDDGKLRNAAVLLADGAFAEVRFKHQLPNYGVFDEKRLFVPGPLPTPMTFRSLGLGVMICEDMWVPEVAASLKRSGADLLVVLNSSPFEVDKVRQRLDLAATRVAETGLALIYLNLVGGQDELVFDGASFVLDRDGGMRLQAAAWKTEIMISRWRRGTDGGWHCEPGGISSPPEGCEAIYGALSQGLRDYVEKNRFPGVVIGLSGGIDSALTAAIAVDALGAGGVRCLMMPSPHTSGESLEDAEATARLLGVRLDTISIEPAMAAFGDMLAGVFAGTAADVTEENIQARARALVLMAFSNKLGHMVLTTGNKSELSVGYATLYGDMCGGFSVLKDVYKTTVYELARWRNSGPPGGALGPAGPVMAGRVLTKAPSAELRPGQTDQDTLPPYDQLDAILELLIEGERSIGETAAEGFDERTVRRIWRMLDRAEHKRRQAPPGVKITERTFGRDRRYPITNRFTDLV